jgi:hypothetical protein
VGHLPDRLVDRRDLVRRGRDVVEVVVDLAGRVVVRVPTKADERPGGILALLPGRQRGEDD